MGHCCFIAVYIAFTPLVQLFSTTLRYLWRQKSSGLSSNSHVPNTNLWSFTEFYLYRFKNTTLYTPCAVEVVLTQAAASGDHGMIKPEGGAAVPIHTAFISIITVKQKVSPQKADERDFTKKKCKNGNDPQICDFLWIWFIF